MTPFRVRLTVPTRRAAAIIVASALGGLGLLVVGTTQVSWPWFSIWIGLLLLISLVGGSGWAGDRLGLTPGRSWLALLAAGALMNLHMYWIQLHRQRSERLDVVGVYTQSAGGLSIGAGVPGLDVRLAGSPVDQERWSMRLRHANGRFEVASLDGVEWLERKRGGRWTTFARLSRLVAGGSEWTPLWGSTLDRERRQLAIATREGASHRLELTGDGRRGGLRWDGRRIALAETASSVLDRRLARRLRTGVALDELTWSGPVDPAARHLVVTALAPAVATPLGFIRWPRYRVASRDSAVRVGSPHKTSALASFDEGDTIRVASRGRVWAFAAHLAPPSRWRASDVVQVSFVQRPTSRGWPLPASDECTGDAACGVISTHPLPPPIALFDIGGFGLDTARYAVLARLDRSSRDRDSVQLVTDTSAVRLGYGVVHPVEAVRIRPGAPPAGYLLRVHRPEASDWGSLAWTVLALTAFMLACGRALRVGPRTRHWLEARNTHATAGWILAHLVTAFLCVRLLLGLRVTYAAPFYERGAATAVGMWIATGVLIVMLAWWPVLWRAVLGLRRVRAPSMAVLAGTVSTQPLPDRRETMLALVPPAALALAIVVSVLRIEDAFGVALSVSLVLFAWLAVAVSELASAPERLGDDAMALLTAETTDVADLRATLAITASLGLAVALASRAPFVTLAVVVLGSVAYGASRLWARRTAVAPAIVHGQTANEETTDANADPMPASLRATFARAPIRRALIWGAVLVGAVSVARLAALLQGPTLLFGIIVMLFLLAVRAGVLCARRLDGRVHEASVGRWRGRFALLSALMLPLGALALAGLFDVGLALVVFVPLFVTVVLAAGGERMGRALLAASMAIFAAALWAASSVLFPSVDRLAREGRTDIAQSAQLFATLGGPVARVADLTEPTRVAVRRALVRGLAARDPELLEQLLPAVGPSEARDEIVPSLEQVWGGRAYAASGWMGAGFARTAVFGRGVSAATSYAENTFSVYVLSEHGALGGLAVLALYAALAGVVLWWAVRARRMLVAVPARAASLALITGGSLLIVLPGAYVALSNLGVVPLTGQNMPFLGLNAWSDVVFVAAITTAMLAALSGLAETERSA